MSYDDWKTRAPEDETYYPTRGIERTCVCCGGVVYVGRDEPYLVQVCCEACQYEAAIRQPTKKGEAA